MCPFPPVHGNRARFLALLEWLRDNDFAVTFILQPLDVEDGQGLDQLAELVDRLEVVAPQPRTLTTLMKRSARSIIQSILPGRLVARPRPRANTAGKDRHIDDWCWPATRAAVRRAIASDGPIAVFTEYALLSKCLEDVPSGILKVIDTVEVFFRNEDRFQTEGLEAPAICTPASEQAALGRADVLVAIQQNDARALKTLFPGKDVITVPHAFRQFLRRAGSLDSETILYVGSSNAFNVHGLREFVQHAWPAIASRVPQATLRIVGSVPAVQGVYAEPRIIHVGRVTDEQLAREYHTAKVVINPQVAGTGLKIKCVEALSAGCPLVTNAAGADGLEDGAGRAYRLADNWNDFADHVVTLLTDEQARVVLETGARTFADRLFSPGAVFAELRVVLGRVREGAARC
jgi:glycosyltransferase involved in cell wall biosynthesis